jgi:hypothetical protein
MATMSRIHFHLGSIRTLSAARVLTNSQAIKYQENLGAAYDAR